MLLAYDVKPDDTLYCVGGAILKELLTLQKGSDAPQRIHVAELAARVREANGVSSSNFTLGLDWLYLLGAIDADGAGGVGLCS